MHEFTFRSRGYQSGWRILVAFSESPDNESLTLQRTSGATAMEIANASIADVTVRLHLKRRDEMVETWYGSYSIVQRLPFTAQPKE